MATPGITFPFSLVESAVTPANPPRDRKSTRLNSSHANIPYAVFCLKKKITEARSVITIKILGDAGYDFAFLDSEHAMLGAETIVDLAQMALACNICPLVRVTDLAYP